MMTLSTFYRSKPWIELMQTLKLQRLNEYGELICEHCGKPIVKKYDCIGHHTIHLDEMNVHDASVALDPEKIMLVHHRCHNAIHNRFGYKTRQIFIVWGSPLSGKTTYVKDAMSRGDLIVDMDSIWQCISGCERYVKPDALKLNAFGIRDTLIEMVRVRRGNWNNAYIIGGFPFTAERERLLSSLGAREIYIESTYEECISRLDCDSERDHDTWREYIDEWWRLHPPTSAL